MLNTFPHAPERSWRRGLDRAGDQCLHVSPEPNLSPPGQLGQKWRLGTQGRHFGGHVVGTDPRKEMAGS